MYKSHHVLGHQDDPGVVTVLDRWATLNCEMDGLAKLQWVWAYSMQLNCEIVQQVEGEPWSIWLGGQKISSNLADTVCKAIQGRMILACWNRRKSFGQGCTSQVDWPVTEAMMKEVKLSCRHWAIKHVAGFCSTGQIMFQWKQCPSPECP